MLGYYRKQLQLMTTLLRDIERSPDDLSTLRRLQENLTVAIIAAETSTKRWRRRQNYIKKHLSEPGLSRTESRAAKKKIDWIHRRIKQYRELIYIWRCFGDGIVFIFLDKHAIKPLAFADGSSAPKETSGNMSGKGGLEAERHVRDAALKAGVPAILSDLTNSIRHGDVCLLGASDPYLIEVKSGRNANPRAERQIVAIERLHEFYSTDTGIGVLGSPLLRRVAVSIPERNHREVMNLLIANALRDGRAFANPEPGLTYIALRSDIRGNPLRGLPALSERQTIFFLNTAKIEQSWISYYPFTLSIRDPEHLLAFIEGRVFLIVFFEEYRLIEACAACGVEVEFTEGPDYSLVGKWPSGESGQFEISHHYMTRIGLEFLSLNWIAEVVSELTMDIEGILTDPD